MAERAALPAGLRITWLGHSTFLLRTPGGVTVLIDPWVEGNPACPDEQKGIDSLDVMLCTHGHPDHIGDAVAIARRTRPVVVGSFELCSWLERQGVEGAGAGAMNKGGSQQVAGLTITMTNAFHSGGIMDGDTFVYGGEPAGYVIELEDGFRLYHAGDTCLFGDMRLIGELYAPTLALLPIGDRFTMGPREAAYACRLLGVQAVMPMHYATFPLLTGTPAGLQAALAEAGLTVEMIVPRPGETIG